MRHRELTSVSHVHVDIIVMALALFQLVAPELIRFRVLVLVLKFLQDII